MSLPCICTLRGSLNQLCIRVEDHVRHWSERLSTADRQMFDEAGIPENPVVTTSEDDPED